MKASIVLTTYNRAATLAQTLPTVLAQVLDGPFEVIVVDDGSNDETASLLKRFAASHPNLRVFSQPNQGQPAARNLALRNATGEIVLFLDDDILCPPTLLAEHLALHQGQDRRFVFGTTLISDRSSKSLASEFMRCGAEGFVQRTTSEPQGRWPEDALMDANVSLPRAALSSDPFRIGVPAFMANTGLALRLTSPGGLSMHHAPKAIAHQIYRKSSRDFCKHDGAARGRSEVLLCRAMPAFRPHSGIGNIHSGRYPKRLLRQCLVRFPLPLDFLFLPLLGLASLFSRRFGARLVAYWSGMESYRAAVRECGGWTGYRAEFGQDLPVLMYHHVGPEVPNTYPELTVSPSVFERQMIALRDAGFHPVTIAAWLEWCRSAKPLPDNPVLLTFDDAYADLERHAFPVLESLAFPAHVFVVTSQLGGTNVWDEARGSGSHRLMTAEAIQQWNSKGVQFFPHSHSHADLTGVDDPQLAAELDDSRAKLKSLLGSDPVAFAYPYGKLDARVVEGARQRFTSAFTTLEGVNGLSTDPLLLHRTQVSGKESLATFLRRARTGENTIDDLRGRVGRLFRSR